MRIKSLTAAAAALAMVAAPVAASANPAQSLSVASSARASASNENASSLVGGTGMVIGLVLAAMFAAALVLPGSMDDGPDSP